MNKVNLQDWVGREHTAEDVLRIQPARFMQATLDREPSLENGATLPPLWHWLYFLDARPASELGRDAHPKRGGFLPPVSLPRRMWAGGRFTFTKPLILGRKARKTSRILSVAEKTGRTGPLCFVTIEHRIFQDDDLALIEAQDLVYREDPTPDAAKPPTVPAPSGQAFSAKITPTEAMLFRYSALTFNGHRIHYDADYARDIEGYDGLVFHGPLLASLLIDLAISQIGRAPSAFTFRGVAPVSGFAPFVIQGTRLDDVVDLSVKRRDGALAMTAHADFPSV